MPPFSRIASRALGRALLICVPALVTASAADAARPLRIAVVHDDGTSGTQTWRGVSDAVQKYAEGESPQFDVKLIDFPYSREGQGLETLLKIVDNRTAENPEKEYRADLVIGPTDSGIFVGLAEHAERLSKAKLPIISSLVTADVPNDKNGWRFRTNVNIVLRAKEISTFLGQHGHGPTAVLYADSEFGKLAEKAFHDFVPADAEDLYKAHLYRGVRDSQPLRTLLQDRPWAIGVFGQRFMIGDVNSDLQKMNQSWYSYDPLIFSVIDARAICGSGIYFVSLAKLPRGPCKGEATLEQGAAGGLAFDTTEIVLAIADGTRGEPGSGRWGEQFRARFSKALDGQELPEGVKTGMRFAGRENRAPLGIYTVQDGEVVAPPPLSTSPARRVVGNWFDVRRRRFGLATVVNVLLIALLVGGLTASDAGRWYSGSLRELPRRRPFRRLLYFNVAVALLVFFVLAEAEAGPFRWDLLFGALVVAFGYQALLKTTILETPAGQRIGLSGIYDRALRRMNDKIMIMRFDMMHEKASFVACTNSFASLRDTLRNLYRRARTRERQEELLRAFDDELDALPEGMDRNRFCAEALLGLMTWEQLQELRLVPQGIPEEDLVGPDPILRASRDFVLADRDAFDRVQQRVDEWLEDLKQWNPERAQRDQAALKQDLQTARTERGMVYRMLQYLFTQWNYDLKRIERAGLISPTFREAELERRHQKRAPWWRRAWEWVARALSSQGGERTET